MQTGSQARLLFTGLRSAGLHMSRNMSECHGRGTERTHSISLVRDSKAAAMSTEVAES